MKKFLFILLVFNVFFISNIYSQQWTFKIATVAPEGSTWMKQVRAFEKDVTNKTNGKVKFIFYSGSVAGDESLVLRKIMLGQLHGGGFTGVGLGQIVPEVRLLELPFHYKTYEDYDKVFKNFSSFFKNKFFEKGYIILGWVDVGFVYLFSQKEIHTVDDMKKTKPWVWDADPMAKDTYKVFGINPTPLSLPDVLTSLQTGLIDTVYISPSALIALQWFTKVKYMMNFPVAYGVGALLIEKKAFSQMPEELQKIVLTSAEEHLKKITALTRKLNEHAIKVLQKKGITVIEFKKEDISNFMEKGDIIADGLVPKAFSKEILTQLRSILKR